jgi:type I restriction enzyme S subunit
LDAKGTGTTFKAVSGQVVRNFPLPIAPASEQERIADALDELLSDLDAGVAALERVRDKLKLYRASVLKAAVEGALTAEWRKQHPHAEPASELLKRILAERRRRWEEGQLRKFKEKDREPPKNWKARYKEPMAPNATNLPPLPINRCWVLLDQILWKIRSGTAKTSQRERTDFPVLKSSAVRHGMVDFEDLNYLHESQSVHSESFLQRRDFLITRLSGSLSYVGCSAVVPDSFCQQIQYPDRIFCGKLVEGIDGRYLSYCFQHVRIRKCLEEAAKSTAGHQRISISDLVGLILPLPPIAEQQEIVELVEDQLSVIDHLDGEVNAKLSTAQALRQSILRQGFSGKLVPRDPTNEPASELLKRIAADRERRAREAASAKRLNGPRPRSAAKTRGKKVRAANRETGGGRIADR